MFIPIRPLTASGRRIRLSLPPRCAACRTPLDPNDLHERGGWVLPKLGVSCAACGAWQPAWIDAVSTFDKIPPIPVDLRPSRLKDERAHRDRI